MNVVPQWPQVMVSTPGSFWKMCGLPVDDVAAARDAEWVLLLALATLAAVLVTSHTALLVQS
jgi:hypothetical protein